MTYIYKSYPPNDEFTTFGTTWGEKDVEIVLAIFSTVEFVKNAIFELPKALRTPEVRTVLSIRWYKSACEYQNIHSSILQCDFLNIYSSILQCVCSNRK